MIGPCYVLALLATILLADLSGADHFVCNWKVGPASPFLYGFQRWCIADAAKSLSHYIDYRCSRDWGEERHGVLIADYNELGPQKLELRTPCGAGGFAVQKDRAYDCDTYPFWAVCFGLADETQPLSNINCLYYYALDDCEWPNQLPWIATPDHLDVWYYEDKSYYPPHGPPSPPHGPPLSKHNETADPVAGGATLQRES